MNGPRYVAFETGGGREWMLVHGPDAGHQVLLLQPLFEEANRCRAIIAEAQRGLAVAGIASWLLDLPGTCDSTRDISDVGWSDWRSAVADAARASGATAVASFRGGCLLDDVALPRWRMSPVAGSAVLRDLMRATGAVREQAWMLPVGLRAAMAEAEVAGEARVARLAADPAAADVRLPGAPPWRRAEPGADLSLSDAIATDIAGWLGP